MSNKNRQKVWKERVAQWSARGLSQRTYAIARGFPIRQVGYCVRPLCKSQAVHKLLPARVAPAVPRAMAIILRNERRWTLNLPGDVSASLLSNCLECLPACPNSQIDSLLRFPDSIQR